MKNLNFFATTAAVSVAITSAALAQATYNVGDKVEVFSPMSQRWEAGTIVALDGSRYMFQADDKNLPTAFWGTTAERIRARGAGAAPPPPEAQAQPALAPPRVDPPRADPAIAPAKQAAANCGGPTGGIRRIAGTIPAPLGQGRWPNGQPLGTPGQTNFAYDANGQKHIVAVAPPGVASFIGTYSLMVGGTWSTFSTRDLGGGVTERTLNWNVPAQANVLIINADGSWYRKSGGQKYNGRWFSLGQNVAQLVGYDGDDWTGSIQRSGGDCRMEMRSRLGQNEWGKRL
ncbi:MAG: hypothetical protein ABIW31_04585 [Novosphingobium sp.]